MSIRLMTLAWATDAAPSDKLVLLALADWSNDHGKCWPSITQLAEKSGMTDRGVQKVLLRLIEAGHIERKEVPGRGNIYHVHPIAAASDTPERRSPQPPNDVHPRTTFAPNESAETPERGSPNTSVTTNIDSGESRARKPAAKWLLPSDIPAEPWEGFEEMRRKIRKPMTDRARALIVNELRKLAEDGHPPGKVLEQSIMRDWQGVFPLKDRYDDRPRATKPSGNGRGSASPGQEGLASHWGRNLERVRSGELFVGD